MKPLFERYRPSKLSDVIGQPKVCAKLSAIRERNGGFGGRAYWIAGGSGNGKTQGPEAMEAAVAEHMDRLRRLDAIKAEIDCLYGHVIDG